MSQSFRIADLILVEGPALTVSKAAGTVTGFTRVTILEGNTRLEFDALAEASDVPSNEIAKSRITWDPKDVTFTDGKIVLDENKTAMVRFLWPNPLSPRNAGLFFRLGVMRDDQNKHLLRFENATRTGIAFFRKSSGWFPFFLGNTQKLMTPSEWRALWANRPIGEIKAEPIQQGALFSSDNASLIGNAPKGDNWTFTFRFAEGNLARAFAVVQIENEDIAVNSRALRLEERDGLRPRPLRWFRAITLQCASVRRDEGAPDTWAVDWIDVPTFDKKSDHPDHLSLRSFWQELARHWPLGLRALRSQNSLTFLPTDIREKQNDQLGTAPWVFRFRCKRSGNGFTTDLASIGRHSETELRFELGLLLGVAGSSCVFEAKSNPRSGNRPFERVTSVTEDGLTHLLHLDIADAAIAKSSFLVGGLVLEVNGLKRGVLKIDWASVRTPLGQPPIAANVDLTLLGGAPRPGTEDPERGFESENDLLERERPLVIDLGAPGDLKTEISVIEDANAERSRVLDVLVQATAKTTAGAADVVIIDPAPMLIARVQSDGVAVEAKTILASYRDDGERPPGWELFNTTGAMTLVLPPQAIGEEMIKGNYTVKDGNARKPVPFEDRPFDFRLSPPARLVLDRTDIDTARASVPWALRRLLDRREGVVGLKLNKARFELLYGLRTRIDKVEGLRVAEQDAFVGRIPISQAIRSRALVRNRNASPFDTREVDYAQKAIKWIRGLFRRPAQLPVFRDFAKRERVVIRDGAEFDFRETRQTADPFAIEKPAATTQDPADEFTKRLPLRGGVDYPFESQNIYKEVLGNPQKGSAGEPQGHVSGLTFGALGGSGSQQASFDNGKSIIITETTQGRLDSLTLIRIGRINMLWHHARHVIVYERTTRTAPRYVGDQPDAFEGMAALRKVKEYVEITQPRRKYPDFPVSADERPSAGPITGCTFETTVIPVKSSWGHDIEEGWIIALRGPFKNEEEEKFYPFPKIFVELARAEGKGEGAINHLARDPSRLYFFTTTRQTLGADTDAWPAWPDVDFPLTTRPLAPDVRYLPGFSGANRQPDAAEHDFGQRRFTIDVEPPEEAANLMHGRIGNGLEARVRNVSLLRGGAASVRSAVEDAVGSAYAASEARIGDSLAELAQHFERIAQRGADATLGELAGLETEARTILANARADADALVAKVEAGKALLNTHAETWGRIDKRDRDNAEVAATKLLNNVSGAYKKEVEAAADRLADAAAKDEVIATIRAAGESASRQLRQQIEGMPFLGAQIRERIESAFGDVTREVSALFQSLKSSWNTTIDEVIARFDNESPVALEDELFRVVLDGRARLVAFGNTFGRYVKDRLGVLFADVPGADGAVGKFTEVVDAAVLSATTAIDETLDVIPPFVLDPPNADELKALFDVILPDPDALFAGIQTGVVDLIVKVAADYEAKLLAELKTLADKCDAEVEKLVSAANTGVAALKAKIDEVITETTTLANNALASVRKEAEDRLAAFAITPLGKALQGDGLVNADLLKNEVVTRVDELVKKLDAGAKIGELARDANDAATRASATLRRVGETIEQAVSNELRNAVQGAEGAALVLSRALAEGPVTDTLRCTREWVGYYYEQVRDALDVTRAAAVFNDIGGNVLNSLSAQVPFDRIRDRVLAQLSNFDLNKLFPDFAGLKLENLLGGVKIPDDPNGEYDWIKIRHGFDRTRLTAWSEITIDKQFDDAPELFTLPPIALSVVQPRFTATSRIEADTSGVRAQRTNARLVADWTVTLNGQLIMSIEQGGLFFDSDGGFDFDFESNNLQLAPALQFVTDAMRSLLPPEEGLTLTPIFPGGISVELSVPLPDIGTGAFTLTGVTLFTHFDLLVAGGFEVRTGLWLSRPDRPFGMAILFLGGGGWFGVDVRYKPTREFETRVSLGLAAGAFVALNFGVARGSAGVLFTVGLDFYRNWLQDGSQDLAISIGILVWGEFSILSIVSAYLRVVLRIEYRNGEMTGYGTVSVSIKICWCFTLRVNSQIRLPFKSSKKSSKVANESTVGALNAPANESTIVRATPKQAVKAYFANLEL
ncbi:MAG TPA: hypothetical protein VF787_22730 [Thermoanaerobaculia bacterium]